MDEWLIEWVTDWVGGWMDRRMNKWMNEKKNERMEWNEWTDSRPIYTLKSDTGRQTDRKNISTYWMITMLPLFATFVNIFSITTTESLHISESKFMFFFYNVRLDARRPHIRNPYPRLVSSSLSTTSGPLYYCVHCTVLSTGPLENCWKKSSSSTTVVKCVSIHMYLSTAPI